MTKTTSHRTVPPAVMIINDLEFLVRLGWSEKERQKKRRVLLNVTIHFKKAPRACLTDQLDDTLCYHQLSMLLQEKIGNRTFKLIEYLAQDVYSFIKKEVPKNTAVTVSVVKYPKIKGLKGGVCFHYGEKISLA